MLKFTQRLLSAPAIDEPRVAATFTFPRRADSAGIGRVTLGFGLLLACAIADAAVFTVTSTASSGAGSLAQAIASANGNAGVDTINFQIAGTGVKVLQGPSNGLPNITDGLIIDGYTQTGAVVNTAAIGATNAVLTIEIDANVTAPGARLFRLSAPTILRGLAINQIGPQTTAIAINSGAATSSVRGCFLGTNAAGTDVSAAQGAGIAVAASAQIGGTAAADRNLFAALGTAIGVFTGGDGSIIEGNQFGTNAAGTLAQANSSAIHFGNGTISNVRVGGTAAASANVIANSTSNGISGTNAAVPGAGNSFLGNRISNNGELGIDFDADGLPEAIDPGDGDTGFNGLENAPELAFVRVNGAQVTIYGKLDGNFIGGVKRVEYFASPTADPSGFGEGALFLGSVNINPGGVSVAVLRSSFTPASMPALPFVVTATSTAADGSTSEFSNAIAAVDGGTLRTVSTVLDSGAGSLRQALLDAASAGGVDTIAFSISGSGPHTINPLSALPSVSTSTVIDGYSQSFSRHNFAATGTDADLRIIIDGSAAGISNGLQLTSGTSIVRGLVLQNFANLGIAITGGSGHRVEGSFIGTDVTGAIEQGNNVGGIAVTAAASGIQIGGTRRDQRNLISGNGGVGANIAGANASVIGNLLGTAANGTSALNNSFGGISFSGTGGLVVGNRIRANGSRGIGVTSATAQVAIRANEISGNGGNGPGIDLGSNGLTANDADDVDTGPNGLQNFPVLSRVEQLQNGGLRVEGSLDRPAGFRAFTFDIDVFRNSACDGTHGEGEIPVLSRTLNFAAGSPETFSFEVPATTVPAASVMTATITDADGNTSEFSECLTSSVQPGAVFANGFE